MPPALLFLLLNESLLSSSHELPQTPLKHSDTINAIWNHFMTGFRKCYVMERTEKYRFFEIKSARIHREFPTWNSFKCEPASEGLQYPWRHIWKKKMLHIVNVAVAVAKLRRGHTCSFFYIQWCSNVFSASLEPADWKTNTHTVTCELNCSNCDSGGAKWVKSNVILVLVKSTKHGVDLPVLTGFLFALLFAKYQVRTNEDWIWKSVQTMVCFHFFYKLWQVNILIPMTLYKRAVNSNKQHH